MSLALLKKKFKKGNKSHIFIVGNIGAGKSSFLKSLQQKLSMIDKGTQNMAGISLETIKSHSEEIFAYNYNETNFKLMMKFLQQPTTKCIIFIIDSRKQHIISDPNGNDIRTTIKEIAKIISPQCHILVLCNKQDMNDEDVLDPDEITKILDIDRTFTPNERKVIGCNLNNDKDIDYIVSYLTETNIIKPTEEETKQSPEFRKSTPRKSLKDVFKRKKHKQKELVLVLGLNGVGKTSLMNAFGFGKQSKTNIAIFESETILCKHMSTTEFHAWNYEYKSWAMAKSFFAKCSLVIFVIDATDNDVLQSDNKIVWSVDTYLKKLLGVNTDGTGRGFKRMKSLNRLKALSVASATDAKYNSYRNSQKGIGNESWPLQCPFLFYINKCDLKSAQITEDDLEQRLHISQLMKSKGIKYFVQQCSTKTKEGIYDGLMWCYVNGLLTDIPEIADYADKNEMQLPLNDNLQNIPAPTQLKQAQTK